MEQPNNFVTSVCGEKTEKRKMLWLRWTEKKKNGVGKEIFQINKRQHGGESETENGNMPDTGFKGNSVCRLELEREIKSKTLSRDYWVHIRTWKEEKMTAWLKWMTSGGMTY